MAKQSELGFGKLVTIGPKDYLLLENCYRDWWIAIEDKAGDVVDLLLVYYPVLDGDWET